MLPVGRKIKMEIPAKNLPPPTAAPNQVRRAHDAQIARLYLLTNPRQCRLQA
jgi:hypothetical protein